MKLNFIIFIFFANLLWAGNLSAQSLNRKSFVAHLKSKNDVVFVINGYAYSKNDTLNLDSVLKSIDDNKISEVTILRDVGPLSYARNPTILIEYATELPKTVVDSIILKIRKKRKSDPLRFKPEVRLNGIKLSQKSARNLIEKLSSDRIAYIYFSEPSDKKYKTAYKGSINIWNKDKLKN